MKQKSFLYLFVIIVFFGCGKKIPERALDSENLKTNTESLVNCSALNLEGAWKVDPEGGATFEVELKKVPGTATLKDSIGNVFSMDLNTCTIKKELVQIKNEKKSAFLFKVLKIESSSSKPDTFVIQQCGGSGNIIVGKDACSSLIGKKNTYTRSSEVDHEQTGDHEKTDLNCDALNLAGEHFYKVPSSTQYIRNGELKDGSDQTFEGDLYNCEKVPSDEN